MSREEAGKLFEEVREEVYDEAMRQLNDRRSAHPSRRDDELLLRLLCDALAKLRPMSEADLKKAADEIHERYADAAHEGEGWQWAYDRLLVGLRKVAGAKPRHAECSECVEHATCDKCGGRVHLVDGCFEPGEVRGRPVEHCQDCGAVGGSE